MQLEIQRPDDEFRRSGEGPGMHTAEQFVEFLVSSGRLDASGALRIRAAAGAGGHGIDTALLELGLLPEQELAAAQAEYLRTCVVEPRHYPLTAVAEDRIPNSFLRNSGLIPLSLDGNSIVVASARPLEREAIEALAYYLDCEVEIRVARRSDFEQAFRQIYDSKSLHGEILGSAEEKQEMHEGDYERLKDSAREAPVIRLVSSIIGKAVERRASDIHIEPLAGKLQIRFRVDGELTLAEVVDIRLLPGLASRIKILAKLNIAERRLPQDGRISLPVRGRPIDFRVSTMPTLHGESVVLRVLDRNGLRQDFQSLGFEEDAVSLWSKLISQPNGIVLISGPTGSGKTSTLYAALCELRSKQRKILTIEDPIEYHLDEVIQTQVKPDIGLTFATGLRAFVRHDPDVIMVGEIRDGETARTAVQASLTGHLVLSTVHTNSAAASVTRLIDMGVEDYLLASTLRAVVSQRLVRRLCACRRPGPDSEALLRRLGMEERRRATFFAPGGCQRCGGRGYLGRTAIYEMIQIAPVLQELILSGAAEAKLEETARSLGMQTLLESGVAKAMAGETSLEEVLQVISATLG